MPVKSKSSAPDRELVNLLLCLGELVLGLLLLFNPVGFATALLIVVGALLSLLGLARLVGYWRTPPELAARGGGLSTGAVLLLAGLFCIAGRRWVLATFPVLSVVFGVLTLLNALHKLQCAVDLWRLKQRYWTVALAGAGLTLAFALLILANPFSTAALLWTVLAVTLLAEAGMDLAGLVLGRRAG